ncbi:MAG: UDP-N-acetylmuramoyl-L-alanyl-D-glutamate--2,6-diaminopimelate ligase [Christensenellaceae bacterium]|jgi:UDP-N-acetylmuramoyl-L-alanyl-D-glutamate--2,6-diaminopimelate ligase|nr:UDP-N-acetylmuramoyl-L-alanyl-D-glutamate--2,6-diaminopimelate ligase [Christensenellaceae bacterium]
MQLKNLIKNIECEIRGEGSVSIKALSLNPNDCKNALLFCYKGVKSDGHDYLEIAQNCGATALVVERFLDTALPQIRVLNTRKVMGPICRDFYLSPNRGLKMIGVCGTNGKTTTTFMLKQIFEAAGHKVCLIGTSGVMMGSKLLPATLTTPDPPVLHKLLRQAYDNGCTVVVMEVSAHAMDLDKLEGIRFDMGVFSNLTQDHLDYFGTMENYAAAKQKFFDRFCEFCIFNLDNAYGKLFFKSCPSHKIGFGLMSGEYRASVTKSTLEGSDFSVVKEGNPSLHIKINMAGRFNVYNALSAAAAANVMGISDNSVIKGLHSLSQVDGRFNVTRFDKVFIVIDYAHSPDGVLNILKAVKEVVYGKILTVFGCGGERDSLKRPIMGRIVAELSDEIIITSDNPRSENPDDIIAQIKAGVSHECVCITDRREAILYALKSAHPGDTVVILGKGAETTQEIAGIKYPFCDTSVVHEFFEGGPKESV